MQPGSTSRSCDRCGGALEASEATFVRTDRRLRVGMPPAPRLPLRVWRCAGCGVMTPRVDGPVRFRRAR